MQSATDGKIRAYAKHEFCHNMEEILTSIKKQKLFDLTLWEGDRIFLRLLQEDAPFFSLKLTYRGDELTEAVLDGKLL